MTHILFCVYSNIPGPKYIFFKPQIWAGMIFMQSEINAVLEIKSAKK